MRHIGLTLLSFMALGCSAGQIKVVSKGVFAEKPGNVAAYVAVSEQGQAMEGLSAENFKIYEDELYIPAENSRQVLLDKELAQAHRTVVLVDHSAATDEDIRKEIGDALRIFVQRVRSTQPVAVYAFDGRKELRRVAEFSKQQKKGKANDQFETKLRPADTSRNLNGAIIEGLKVLDRAYDQRKAPLRAGTLVVFSGGPDLAGRVDGETVREAIDLSGYSIIAVGLGDSAPQLRDYGRDGFVDGHSVQTLSMAFEEAGYLVEDDYKRHYLLAYCSPARAGERTVSLEVVRELPAPAVEGQADGAVSAQMATGVSDEMGTFNSNGFAEGCDPARTPKFKAVR